ncbi:MAG: DNA polymerase III subunit beta [Mycoplasmataceae bacterium]|nr:DNA polymerase III subunit beta [Mycoplasmataceae bacterium]
MKFTINKNSFLKALKQATNIIDNNNINPVLSGILINCKDKTLTITSSNNNISFITTINDANIQKEGIVLVRGKILFNIINKLKNEDITIEIVDNSVLRISTSNFSSDINTLESTSYPSINFNYEGWKKIVLPKQYLKNVINKLINTTTIQPDHSTILNGILFDSLRLNNFIESVGTDGYHLSHLKQEYIGEKFKFVLGIDSLLEISELVMLNDDVIWYFKDNHLIIQINNVLFNCRLLDGEYPSSVKFIEEKQPNSFSVKKEDLYSAIERGMVLASDEKKPSIMLNITDEGIKLTSRSVEFGSSFEQIPISNYSGQQINVTFNIKYLLDLIKNIESEEILIEFDTNTKPFIFKDKKTQNYTSLILPIRAM